MSPDVAKVPPSDLEAERALIASLLLDDGAIRRVSAILRRDDFYGRVNGRMYGAIHDLHLDGKCPDPVLVRDRLRSLGHLDDVGGIDGIKKFLDYAESGANAVHYAVVVREAAHKRELLQIQHDLEHAARNGVPALDATSEAILRLEQVRSAYATQAEDLFQEVTVLEGDKTTYLIRGLLARGCISIVHGLPKAGKTTFVYGMIAALQRGDPAFIGLASPASCSALILTEEPAFVIDETFRTLGVDPKRARALTRERAFPKPPLSVTIDTALRAIERDRSIAVVVIDTWRFWSGLGDKQENDAGAVNKAFDEFRRLAASGVAVVLIHHSRKSGGEEGTAAAGSNALTGSADLIVEIKRFGKGESSSLRVVEVLGRLQRLPDPLVVNYAAGRYSEMGDADRARDRLREDRIRSILASAARWLSRDEVIEASGMKQAAALEALRSLAQRREIQKIGKGVRGSPDLYASLDVSLHKQPAPPVTPPDGSGS